VPAVEAILFAVAAGFAVIVIATILVIIGVRHEERNRTLTHQHPPTITSTLARRVLRTSADRSPDNGRNVQRITTPAAATAIATDRAPHVISCHAPNIRALGGK